MRSPWSSTNKVRATCEASTGGENLLYLGCHVIATARKPEALQALRELGMSAVQLEVTDAESIAACKAEVDKITGGKLDILVNNAYVFSPVPLTRRCISPTHMT